ncbi:MAG: HupE/UreJ family protein [Acidobacteriota bacterium]
MKGILFLLLWVSSPVLLAHSTSTSYSLLNVHERKVDGRLIVAIEDLSFVKEIDSNSDLIISQAEAAAHRRLIFDRLSEHYTLSSGGKTASPALVDLEISPQTYELICDIRFDFEDKIQELLIGCTLPAITNSGHVHLSRINHAGQSDQVIFDQGFTEHRIMVDRGLSGYLRQVRQFVFLGIEHIFTGWDHILFLVTVLLIGSSLKELVKVVTSFTLAHSITLILAVLGVVSLSSRFVESFIAISIVYTAMENLLRTETAKRWMITSAFGLIHGFGFAGILRDLELPRQGLMLSLFSFNVGVEMGQLAIVLILFPALLYATRFRWQPKLISMLSFLILCIGFIWFFQRAL